MCPPNPKLLPALQKQASSAHKDVFSLDEHACLLTRETYMSGVFYSKHPSLSHCLPVKQTVSFVLNKNIPSHRLVFITCLIYVSYSWQV
jgi:hypothetical protein